MSNYCNHKLLSFTTRKQNYKTIKRGREKWFPTKWSVSDKRTNEVSIHCRAGVTIVSTNWNWQQQCWTLGDNTCPYSNRRTVSVSSDIIRVPVLTNRLQNLSWTDGLPFWVNCLVVLNTNRVTLKALCFCITFWAYSLFTWRRPIFIFSR